MTRALFIIDVQNDFTEGGALAVEGGGAVAAGITKLLTDHRGRYSHVFASRDWHDAEGGNDGHFAAGEPDYVSSWPVHCVAGSEGAEYHPAFDSTLVDVHLLKGQGTHGYSIFEGTTESGEHLSDLLTAAGVVEVDVVGLATDYCVRQSALDAVQHGQHVRIITDLVAAVDQESGEAALAELAYAGAALVTTETLD